MSFRQKLFLVVGVSLLAAACSSPVAPNKVCDVITFGSGSRCE